MKILKNLIKVIEKQNYILEEIKKELQTANSCPESRCAENYIPLSQSILSKDKTVRR